jgi:hypothetical protein
MIQFLPYRNSTMSPLQGWSFNAVAERNGCLFRKSFETNYCTLEEDIKMFNVGHAVAQLVEALRYKLAGRGFDSPWSHWNFSLT